MVLLTFLAYPFLYGVEKKRKPVVAFVGTRLEEIPEIHHARINLKFHNLFSEQQGILYIGPNPMKDALGEAAVDSVIGTSDLGLLKRAATQAGADHLFFAMLENQSQHENRVMLVGNVVRYDLETDQLYRMEVLKYLEDFGIEIARVKLNLPMATTALTFGVIMVLGLLMLFFLKTEVNLGGEGSTPTDNTGDPGLIG
ncbi:MAG TPA: hypothetical protein EYN68_09400 [Candidatus Marinimicrobia bacterium]|nr:hypothetical protein [Candidatus Neomarinimicrobiota bacterium]